METGRYYQNSYNSQSGVYAFGASNTTIQNFGPIKDFSSAVVLLGGESALVTNITSLSTMSGNNNGITIQNCKNCSAMGNVIQGGLNGIIVDGGLNNSVTSNRITNNTNGMVLLANETKIEDNVVLDNVGAGIEIADNVFGSFMYGNRIHGGNLSLSYRDYGGSGYGAIYNNYLAGLGNVGGDGNGSLYTWTNSAGPKPGTNVAGGPYIAGNYWSNPDGTGWSDRESGNVNGYSPIPYEVLPGSNLNSASIREYGVL